MTLQRQGYIILKSNTCPTPYGENRGTGPHKKIYGCCDKKGTKSGGMGKKDWREKKGEEKFISLKINADD